MLNKKAYISILKYVISILSIVFIIARVKQYDNLELFSDKISKMISSHTLLLFVAISLMIFNWGFEAIKWRILINYTEKISFYKSLKSVFIGLSMAVITPNRIGELPGRTILLKKKNKIQGLLATSLGSISQISITLFNAIIALTFLLIYYPQKNPLKSYANSFVFIFSILIVLIILLFLFNINKLHFFIRKIPYIRKFSNYLRFYSRYKRKDIIHVILHSFFRYIIFLTQFLILLQIFKVDINVFEGFIAIGMSYLKMLFIPFFAITEIGIRGSLALICIGIFSEETAGILFASITLWIINIAIPAIIGVVLINKHKFI